MSHRRIRRSLEEYAGLSDLPEALKLEVEEHLRVCSQCQDDLWSIRLTRSILSSSQLSEGPEPAPGFAKSVLKAVQEQEAQSSWFSLRLVALQAVPIMLLLALFLGLMAYSQFSSLKRFETANQPLADTFADLPAGWSQDLTVFSETVYQDRDRVVKVLMESQPMSSAVEKDKP
jgi:hypothetical protein